jgi:hypothetical protein
MMKFKIRIWSTTFIEVQDQDLKHNFHWSSRSGSEAQLSLKFMIRLWSTTFIEVQGQALKHNFHDKQYKTQKIHSTIQVFVLGGRTVLSSLNTVKSRSVRKLLTGSSSTDDMSTSMEIGMLLATADSNCNVYRQY